MNHVKYVALCILAATSLLFLAACGDTGTVQEPSLDTLGGGSFGLARGSINLIFEGRGVNGDYKIVAEAFPVTVQGYVINPGGESSPQGIAQKYDVDPGKGTGTIAQPSKKGKVRLLKPVLDSNIIGFIPPPEIPNKDWTPGIIVSVQGQTIKASAYKNGDLEVENCLFITKDDGEQYLYVDGSYVKDGLVGDPSIEWEYVNCS